MIGLLAALPVIVSTIQAIHLGWTPSTDDGPIALRAFDVFSSHSFLLGTYSQTSPLVRVPVYSLGPMLFWVLAIPAHIGPAAIVITMGLISTLAVVGIVAIAYRRGGLGLMVLAAGTTVVMIHSLPAEAPYEVWNCWAGLFPFIALIFIAWSVACGDFKLLPLLSLIASYVVQCHLAYVLPAICCVVVAVGGLILDRRAVGSKRGRSDTDRRRSSSPQRWTIASIGVLVIAWIGPVIEEITHRPGNLVLAVRLATAKHATVGASAGLWSVARAIGLPPLWLKEPGSFGDRFIRLFRAPPIFTEVTAVMVLLALIVILIIALRRERRDIAAAVVLAGVLTLSVGVVAESIPTGTLAFAASLYVLMWTSPVGMFVYVVVAWSAWNLRPVAWRFDRPIPRRGSLVAGALILALSVLVANRPADSPDRLPFRLGTYNAIRAITKRSVDGLNRTRPVLMDVTRVDLNSLTFASALAYEMRRKGIPFAVPPRVAREFGDQYCPEASRYPDVMLISDGGAAPQRGETVFARSSVVTIGLASSNPAIHSTDEAHARHDDAPAAPSRCPLK